MKITTIKQGEMQILILGVTTSLKNILLTLNTLSSDFNEVQKQKSRVHYNVLKTALDPYFEDFCDYSGSGGLRLKHDSIACVDCVPQTKKLHAYTILISPTK